MMRKSLYRKSIAVIVVIFLISCTVAFLGANQYYHHYLKPKNDAKITKIARQTATFYQSISRAKQQQFLEQTSATGYQLLVIKNGHKTYYGGAYRQKSIPKQTVNEVLSGEIYHGIANYNRGPFIIGFFDNDIRNTVGIQLANETALFIRANPNAQFGELRAYFTVMGLIIVVLAVVLLILAMKMIVNPIRRLTNATKKVANGDYEVALTTKSQDELGELVVAFTTMSRDLSKVEASRNEFVANVSHDLQSPLAAIAGYTESLLKDALSPKEQQQALTTIQQESKRLSHLIKQLLLLSSVNQTNQLAFAQYVDIKSQLQELLQTFRFQLDEKELMVSATLMKMMIVGNSALLYQVWQNILTNSISYAPRASTLKITTKQVGNTVQVSFANQGPMIPSEVATHLFERFYQADKSRQNRHSGLGLSIADKIIHLHHGQIHVDSNPEWTIFTVILPLAS